jgi:hypothetical protein
MVPNPQSKQIENEIILKVRINNKNQLSNYLIA